jgi:hypothetical protein
LEHYRGQAASKRDFHGLFAGLTRVSRTRSRLSRYVPVRFVVMIAVLNRSYTASRGSYAQCIVANAAFRSHYSPAFNLHDAAKPARSIRRCRCCRRRRRRRAADPCGAALVVVPNTRASRLSISGPSFAIRPSPMHAWCSSTLGLRETRGRAMSMVAPG